MAPSGVRSSRGIAIATMVAIFLGSVAITAAPASSQPSGPAVRVVTLGDSYISGNGAGSYSGPARCYRSRNAFGQRWAELQSQRGARATHTNGACSGARTRDIDAQIVQVRDQLRTATHVMVTIGGNDAGFGDLVFQCLVTRDRGDCEDAVEDATDLLPELAGRLRSKLTAIAAAAPDATIVVVGYPLLVGANTYRLPGYEAGNAIRTLGALAAGAYLAEVRGLGADGPGRYVYADLHDLYAGHELGGPRRDWIRQIGTTTVRAEWVHPTSSGHAATAAYLDSLVGLAGPRLRLRPGDVVVDPDGSAAVAVGADGLVRRIASGSAGCLTAAAPTVHRRSGAAIVSLPIRAGEVATCAGPALIRSAPDVDGDGRPDLIVGAPLEDIGPAEDAGAMTVASAPLGEAQPSAAITLVEGAGSVPGTPEPGDRWGAAMAVGDFDGDGVDDVAVGAPGQDSAGALDAGAVSVLLGGSAGPGSGGATVLDQGTPGIGERSESGDGFGAALVAGDIDGDGYDDLVVGIAGEGLSGRADVGAIAVVPGSAQGLRPLAATVHHQERADVQGSNEAGDRWGSALAIGDLNGDGYDDVVVGAPGESIGSARTTGTVAVLWGSGGGVRGATTVHQGTAGVPGANQTGDRWGSVLAVGDLDGDGIADLAVGAPDKTLAGRAAVGTVTVFVGSVRGLRGAAATTWHQRSTGVPGVNEAGDRWGLGLAIGDLNGDLLADLVVGAPGESIGGTALAGAATVLVGSPTGVTAQGAVVWHQNVVGVPGVNESGDGWGAALVVADLDADEMADLSVGAPSESIGGVPAAGAVTVLRGSVDGLARGRNPLFHQGLLGLGEGNEAGDGWGAVLAGGV